MRIIKPLRLSLLTRPYTHRRQHWLGVSVLAMATLGDDPVLRPEAEIWRQTGAWLEEDNVVDLAVPKPCAEFLVSGRAWSHDADTPGRAALRVRVAGLEKNLLVSGDRRGADGRWTEPEPLRGVPVDWRHAFGGPDVAENPCGAGAGRGLDGLWKAPNVESLHQRASRPGEQGRPASFGPVSPVRPRRFARAGGYDPAWLENGFPGFPDTLDPHFFNAAEPDQWLEELDAFEPGTPYAIWNMHETSRCIEGVLPCWKARCFIVRGEDEAFEEVPLRHTTAWFFPDSERVLLMFHGTAPTRFDDASDIGAIMPAIELVDAPERGLDHYRQVLAKRQAPGTGPLHALKDSDLLPRSAMRDEDFFDTDALNQPLMVNQQRRADGLRDEMQARIRQAGHDPAAYDLEKPLPADVHSLDALPELVRAMRREGRRAKASMLRQRRDARRKLEREAETQPRGGGAGAALDAAGSPPPGGPPKFNTSVGALSMIGQARDAQARRARGDAMEAGAMEADKMQAGAMGPDQVRSMLDQGQQGMEKLYLAGAHLQSPVPVALGGRSVRMRRRVQALMQGSRDLSGLDLTGVDLSGLDLSGAHCRHTWMEGADLRGARLDGADLSDAVLTRARLHDTSLADAVFERANLGGLSAEDSCFDRAVFIETVLDQAAFTRCGFAGAVMEQCSPLELELTDCRFDQARFKAVNFLQQSRFLRVRFERAAFQRVVWLNCMLDGVHFEHAQLTACGWVQSECASPPSFLHSHLQTCCAVQTDMAGALFSHAWLEESSLRGIDLSGAKFDGARLQSSDLSESILREACFHRADGGGTLLMQCDLTGADLRESDWIDAILSKSDFRFADLAGANLFRADISQSRLDAGTRTAGAYVKWAKTLPAMADEGAGT